MFFEKEYISCHILDVLQLDQQHVSMVNSGRNFDSVSFRYSSDAFLECNGQRISTSDNSICFVPSGLSYSRNAEHDRLIAVHMDVNNYFTNKIEHFIPTEPQIIAELFGELFSVWESKCIGYKYRATAILYQIFARCYIQAYREEPLPQSIADAVRYINEHITDPALSVSEAAKRSYVSEVYFRKIFKQHFGISPAKYMIKLRIQHAIGLMSTGYYTLSQVAELSGYSDYPYFSAEFKRIKGVCPSKYLESYKSEKGS